MNYEERTILKIYNMEYNYFSETIPINDPVVLISSRNSETRTYFYNGVCHREDEPAKIYDRLSYRVEQWYKNGKFHRLYGPADMFFSKVLGGVCETGVSRWFVHGKNITNDVRLWMLDNEIQHYETWTDKEKILFKLKFG